MCFLCCLGDEDGPLYGGHESMSCLCVVRWNQCLLGALCAECHAHWFEEEAGVFICRASVVWRWCN